MKPLMMNKNLAHRTLICYRVTKKKRSDNFLVNPSTFRLEQLTCIRGMFQCLVRHLFHYKFPGGLLCSKHISTVPERPLHTH